MNCPNCGGNTTFIVDSRQNGDGTIRRRRYECYDCKKRFTTYETLFHAGTDVKEVQIETRYQTFDEIIRYLSKQKGERHE